MKTWIRIAATVLVLMAGSGCVILKSDEDRNEVVRDVRRIDTDPACANCHFSVTCIEVEQAATSAGDASAVSDVLITCSPGMLQGYRIEGRKVTNFRWSDYLLCWIQKDSATRETQREPEIFLRKEIAMREAHEELPSRLYQNRTRLQPLGGEPALTVTRMVSKFLIGRFTPEEAVYWGNRTVWQWAGTHGDTPAEIETFRQSAAQVLSDPKYARQYRSYLRAVPLFTEEELEAEKDTPLLDLRMARYHAWRAVQYPYLLIPVPERQSPFPAVGNYTPGDTFKVRCDHDGKPYYFRLDTFAGETRGDK